MSEIYEKLGKDYDRMINWEKRIERDVPLITWFLEKSSGRTLLDAACGTGKLTIALAESGYQCTGLDAQPSMINTARQHAESSSHPPRFLISPLQHMDHDIESRFDSILILGNSLSYLHTTGELEDALRSTWNLLNEKRGSGLLIQNRYYALNRKKTAPIITQPSNDLTFVRKHIFLDHSFYEMHLWRIAGNKKELIGIDRLRHWSPGIFIEMLKSIGFKHIQIFGNLDRVPFDSSRDGDIVLWAEKLF